MTHNDNVMVCSSTLHIQERGDLQSLWNPLQEMKDSYPAYMVAAPTGAGRSLLWQSKHSAPWPNIGQCVQSRDRKPL